MKIIINADDFGYSRSINRGIVDSYNEGLISSTTIMINMPYAEDAIKLYKNTIGLGLGLHLNITAGSPILSDVPSLVDEYNIFHHHEYYEVDRDENTVNYDDIYREMKAQIEKLKTYDVKITHLDCHHFINKNDIVGKAVFSLAEEYQLPLRIGTEELEKKTKDSHIKTTGLFCDKFFGANAKAEIIIDYLNQNSDVNSIEIMTHVGYIDEYIKNRTSYIARENEIDELRKLKNINFFNEITLINYGDL